MEVNNSQTNRSFQDKWEKNTDLAFELTQNPESNFQKWILERNGFRSLDEAKERIKKYNRILDAGCGNGRATALWATIAPHAEVVGIDQIDVSIPVENSKNFPNVKFFQKNLRESLDGIGTFDYSYCQEVLHHTGNAESSFENLVKILKPSGILSIYVYKEKAPAREFMDDYIREKISNLPYDEAMKICLQITQLGKILSQVKEEVEVDEIPILGIEKGKYIPQRILYNFFLKCYYNEQLSDHENAVINYDWYHPQNCSRHTLEEVLEWYYRRNFSVTWSHVDLYGITVHGLKNV